MKFLLSEVAIKLEVEEEEDVHGLAAGVKASAPLPAAKTEATRRILRQLILDCYCMVNVRDSFMDE